MPRFIRILVEETRSVGNLKILSMAFKRLWSKGSRLAIVFAVLLLLIEAVLYTVDPWILRHLIDTLTTGYDFGWTHAPNSAVAFWGSTCKMVAINLTWVMIVASVLWFLAFNLGTGLARNATYFSQVTFATEVFRHILGLSMDFHVKSKKGEVLVKSDQGIIAAQDFLYNSIFMTSLRAAFAIVFVLVAVWKMDSMLFLICAVTLFVGFYTNIFFGSRVSKQEKLAWRNVSAVQARSLDVMYNIKETKVFGNEEFEVQRRQSQAEEQLIPLRRVTVLWRWLTSLENVWQNVGFAVAMFVVVLPGVFSHRFTVGQTAQFIGYYLMLFGYFVDILFKYLNAQRLVPRLQDIKEILDTKSSVLDIPTAQPFSGLKECLRFNDVNFFYGSRGVSFENLGIRRRALEQVNLELPKGSVTVIAGRTGSGKTTLANLLMRLYDPVSGCVTVDGVDIRRFTQSSYHRAFTYLSQEAFLFNASVEFNIAYSRVGASYEEVVEAAKIAQAHDFICQMEDGYNTILSERSSNISGGQKQRIALARAVLARDADIAVLDEPTTGLDPKTSAEFLDELVRIFAGKTIVMITHDPNVMVRADQVVFVNEGKIEQVDSHHHLLESSPSYRQLVMAG